MEEALELVRTKDTKERMAGVEHLHQLLEASRKPLSSSEVTFLVDACLDLLKDNNFRVSQGALQALASATVLAGDHLKIHFNALVPAAVERLGDAKQPVRDAARRLLLTLMEVSSPTIIVERAGSYAWEHKSWRVREEFARTVTSAISLFASTELPLQRAILPPILQMLNDPNHVVREAATACIEEMYRQMGSQFLEELQRHQLPSYMVKDINARLERIEPKVRSSNDRNNLGSASEHKHVNLGSKKSSHKPKHPSRETLLSGGDSDVTAKPVEPINVYSEKELITEFEKIASTLVPEKDGSIRIAAMQRLEGLVIGGATDYPSFCGLLKRLVCPLSTQLADGRSTVVKQACHLLKVLSMELLGDFESCAEIFIPVLFKLVVITVLVIAESADNCIKMMLRNCKVARILPRIAYSAKNDRSAVLRARCCEYALVILEHWPDAPEIQRSADIYEDLIKCCVGDAMSEVSSTARTCSRLFAKTWPERSMGLFQSFDPVIQRIVNEEDDGLHRRHASPSVHERNVSHTPLTSAPLNLPGYGTSTIVAMEKTSSLSSRASLSSGLLSSQAKQQSKGTDCSLESVLHSSKQKVTAIESLLRGLDLSERHKFSNIQSSSLDLGIDPPSSRDPSVPFAVTASNEFANLSLDAKLSAVNDGNSCNGDLANCVLKGPTSCLIAQDTSKDFESRHDSPNVVAKLMGLDAPSHQQELYDLAHGSRNPQFHFDASYSEIPSGYWHQEDGFVDGEIDCGVHQCQEEHNCKDTYEMWQLSLNTNYLRNLPLQKGRCSENANEQKMALIYRKFMDAKRLSTDENSCQTKEFQDAVDVLSSNQHLFLKVFQESNSLISHHLYERQPIPLLNETKRITVLKPSKMVFNDKFPASGNRNEKQVRKSCPRNHFGLSPVASTRRVGESSTQTPTRIVVLKPTPGLIQDVMAAIPSITSSPTNLRRPKFFEVPREDEIQEAREVAKEITQQMRENLSGHQRNETILSSVLSCGYTGDESSFNKSEAEFEGKHSWDYINPNGDPYSSSSLSHASYTPESSVTKEAKKRLSERWAVMASNGTCSEQRHVRRSASTLGEMLALSDIKKLEMFEVDDIKRDQDHRVSTSCLISNADGVEIESPRSLLRSKSLPVNSLASNQRLGDESLDREARKIDGSTKQGTKSSFRGKVTSLFFQRSKKLDKGKTDKSQYQDKVVSNYIEASVPCGMPCDNNLEYSRPEEFQSSDLQSANRTLWCKLNDETRQRLSLEQVPWSTSKPATPGTSSEIQDQPSPISVLESPFEENGIVPNQLGKQPAFSLGRSNLIDKSPPIGSIARTLSWDESSAQPGTSNSLKSPFLFGGSHKEADWLFLIQSLLSAAGVEKEAKLHTNPSGWHSPDSPLNPLLREKYVNSIYKEPLYKANRRQLRLNCLLVFDCINGALVELSGMGSNATKRIIEKRAEITPSGEMLTDRIWAKLMHSFMRSDWKAKDGGDNNSVVVECLVHKELAGKGWEDLMMVEIDIIGKEIEEKLLEELVEDSISGWTGKMMGLKKHRN